MLAFLDAAFLVFHSLLIAFILTGWIWKRTRRFHLVALGLVFFSWVGLGMFVGIGYCPFTDWHWQVKRARGETDLPASYVKYHLDRAAGLDTEPRVVDAAVATSALAAFAVSVWLATRDRK